MAIVPVLDSFDAIVANDPDEGGDGRLYHDRYRCKVWPRDLGIAITAGDLVYADSNDAKPATSQADAGTEAANQESFHDLFAGIAIETIAAGDNRSSVRVATEGIFRGSCPSSTFEVAAIVGASENGAGNGLENQQVEGVATNNLSIGMVHKRVPSAATEVEFEVVATYARFHGVSGTA